MLQGCQNLIRVGSSHTTFAIISALAQMGRGAEDMRSAPNFLLAMMAQRG